MANVIFDFDGTIADSLIIVIKLYEQLSGRSESVSPTEIERLRSMALMQVAVELKIRPWKIPFLLAQGRRMMRQQTDSIQAFAGMPELIRELHADGHKLYIMSSNSVQNIRPLLKRYEVYKEFIKLYGSAGILGKATVLRRLMKRQHLDPVETYYVGDEVRDIEAAQRAGMRIISVTWGYNSEAILRKHRPDFVVSQPAGIKKALQS